MKFSRREIITHLSNIIGAAGAYPLIASPLIAQDSSTTDSDDDHFFIFVELKGGVHHTVIADYPNIDVINKIAAEKERAVTTFPLGDTYESFLNGTLFQEAAKKSQLSAAQQKRLFDDLINSFENKLLTDSIMLNGYFCALPYDAKKPDDYYYQGAGNIRLGPAALSLANYAAKMSVLRGVFMRGTFHGLANEEIYSGSSDRKGSHIAGVLARLLEKKYGTKPLDNLVLGRASYVTTNEGDLKTAVQVPFATIRALAEKDAGNINLPLSHADTIARALQTKYGFGNKQRDILNEYLAAFNDAEQAKQNLQKLMQAKAQNFAADSSDGRPIRLSLGVQLDACLSLIKSGMSRVLTVCVGEGDGFGGFDSHRNYYHDFRSRDRYESNYMSFFNFTKLTMDDLAAFMKKIETEDYKDGKKWKDVLTVVVSSEFGRSNNFSGSDNRDGQFGNDHYYFNNNYIFLGKNVRAGQWLGASDPITRHAHVVDFCKLNSGIDSEVEKSFEDPLQVVDIDASNKKLGQMIALKEGYLSGNLQVDMNTSGTSDYLRSTQLSNGSCSYRSKRALMAKDVVHTIMAIAGVEADFSSYYVDDFYRDAQVIAALVAK